MIANQTPAEFNARLMRLSKEKKDFVAAEKSFTMVPDCNGVYSSLYLGIGNKLERLTPSAHTHQQIATTIGVNQGYYDKCRFEAPELLASNVNHWFHKGDKRRMFRTVGDSLRAMVSDRYLCIDSDEVIPALLPVLADQGMVIESGYVDDDGASCYLQAFAPKVEGEVRKGDVVQAGVIFKTGDLGDCSFGWAFAVKRLVCLNGMVSTREEDTFSMRHLGPQYSGRDGVYTMGHDTRQALSDSIRFRSRDFIEDCGKRLNDYVSTAREAAAQLVTSPPYKAMLVVQKLFGLSDEEKGRILTHFLSDGDMSRWGLANAVTRAAAESSSYDRAVELEATGDFVMRLTGASWDRIAQAA